MMSGGLISSLVLYKAFLALATIVSGALTTPTLSGVEVYYYAFPFQAATLIFSFLLPDPVTLLFIIVNSLTAGLLFGGNFVLTIFSFVGGLAAVYGVKLYRRRYRAATLRAGFIVLPAVNALIILAFHLILRDPSFTAFPAEVAMGIFGGAASAVFAFILLPLVESAFGFVTGSKLLELTNSDLPIFRQLSEEAPGSYHHSLIVASLAEKAAEELGLDTQLAKAGALYHDIGKTKMPEYFIENRSREFDLHKDLTPSMSTLVIKNHVKEGAELARKLKLPRALREIIEQHHGNSLVRFFYAKAKQTYDPEEQTVGEESFRYPGPPPQSKEAGLVMLADAIEAASRSLKAPTKDNLKRVITDIINGTLQDGQLDACDFSLRELRTVAAAFLTVLYAIYHPRVEYPGFSFEGRPNGKKKAPGKNGNKNNTTTARKTMVTILNRQKKHRVRTKAFERLLGELARRYRLADPEVSLAFVGDRAIRTLNRKFMKKDRPTDVLSFPLGEKGPDGKFYLGDIVIAVPVAFRQARQKGHGLDRELRLLAIHGFLHLLGYDHFAGIEEEERKLHRIYLA